MKLHYLGALFLLLGCGNSKLNVVDYQNAYLSDNCSSGPVYINYYYDPPDTVKKVENDKVYYSFLGAVVDKKTPIYIKEETCRKFNFEKDRVQPLSFYKLTEWVQSIKGEQ